MINIEGISMDKNKDKDIISYDVYELDFLSDAEQEFYEKVYAMSGRRDAE